MVTCLACNQKEQNMSTSGETFKVGDLAVYPAHGVGKVTSIESKKISGTEHRFYVLHILDTGMKVMVPVNKSGNVGLRSVIDRTECEEVFGVLRKKDCDLSGTQATWNRRYREYMEKIKSGNPVEIAKVLRELYLLREDKELSFGERKMLDTAKTLLVKELSIAKGTDEHAMAKEVEQIFIV